MRGPEPVDFVSAGFALVVLAGRRRWPAQLLVLAAVVHLVSVVITRDPHPLILGSWIVVAFTYADRVERRLAWTLGGATAAVMLVGSGLLAEDGWVSPETLGVAAWSVAAIALGDVRRTRRAYITEVEARARRAEETREEEARRRVAEERMRIARELHDVVAHHIAVINVQAGAAAHVLETRPEAVGPALANIRRAADTVTRELASVVGLLRDAEATEASTEPTRGLARLSELLDAFAAAGLRVEHRQEGPARELPAVVDLAAYRIVQESLTNAHKHGTGTARLTVSYGPEAVRIEVGNPVAADARGDGSGYGLVGMRERAAAAGGTLTAGPGPGDRFTVRAELPAAQEVPS